MGKKPQTNTPKNRSAQAILERIDLRVRELERVGQKVSDRSLSEAATGSPFTVASIRKNVALKMQRGVSINTMVGLAKALGVTEQWLSTGEGSREVSVDAEQVLADDPPPAASRGAQLRGYVGAGNEAHYYALSDEDYEFVDPFPGASRQQVALEIKGKSWGPLMERWLVFYDDIRSPVTDDLLNKTCVVGLADDRVLIKAIRREADGSFTLTSNNPEEPPIRNAIIEWAAPVIGVRPR